MARVPWLEPGILMKAFDAGAYGVICPMVNTRDDAARLVSYVRYAPQGTRSFGPIEAGISYVDTNLPKGNMAGATVVASERASAVRLPDTS